MNSLIADPLSRLGNKLHWPTALRNATRWFADVQSKREFNYTFSCAKKESITNLIDLRKACESGAKQVSKIFRFSDDFCRVQDQNDPLLDMKIGTQLFVIHKNVLHSIFPVETFAFATELVTGTIMYLGLCAYPKFTVLDGEHVQIHDTEMMHWRSQLQVNPLDRNDAIEKHVNRIMDAAASMNMLRSYVAR